MPLNMHVMRVICDSKQPSSMKSMQDINQLNIKKSNKIKYDNMQIVLIVIISGCKYSIA